MPFRKYLVSYILITLVFSCQTRAGVFSWMFGRDAKNEGEEKQEQKFTQTSNINPKSVVSEHVSTVSSKAIPFEMQTVDEKFIAEMQTNLSPLDLCHHKVIAQVKGTCSEMSEEDLAKLAVLLLNCQSKTEGRKVFACTEDMTLRQCTQDMDPTVWNAYQIVSNRVRAICYTARQQQFRLRTEMTVNRLVQTAQGQLDLIKDIQNGQEKISATNSETLNKMVKGQNDLMAKQQVLKKTQQNLEESLTSNLHELAKERVLIGTGHRELADLTTKIKEKLDMATEKLNKQGESQKQNHEEVLADLDHIRKRAHDVWQKIDNSSKYVLQFQNETNENYKATLDNLKRVNATVLFVITTIDQMKDSIESKLNWVTSLVGGTDMNLKILSVCALHFGYLLLAALSAAFLHTPAFSRAVLLLMVPINAVAEIQHGTSLGFLAMTAFISLTVLANWTVAWLWYLATFRQQPKNQNLSPTAESPCKCWPSPAKKALEDGLSQPDVKRLISLLEHVCKQKEESVGDESLMQTSPIPDVIDVKTPHAAPLDVQTPIAGLQTPMPGKLLVADLSQSLPAVEIPQEKMMQVNMVKRDLLAEMEGSPRRSRSSTPLKRGPGSRSSTPNRSASRPLCCGTTKAGAPCKLPSAEDSDYCYRHKEQ